MQNTNVDAPPSEGITNPDIKKSMIGGVYGQPDQEEIMSPYKKKRGTLVKLKTIDSDSDDQQDTGLDLSIKKQTTIMIEADYDILEQVFDKIQKNYNEKKEQFEKYENMSIVEKD